MDNRVFFSQLCRPSQTPHLTMSRNHFLFKQNNTKYEFSAHYIQYGKSCDNGSGGISLSTFLPPILQLPGSPTTSR